MDDRPHLLVLDQKPCFVQYLEEYDKFIIGTYELYPNIEVARLKLKYTSEDGLRDTLKSINSRAGKLILLDGSNEKVPNIVYEFECHLGGGIFDAKVIFDKIESNYIIFVAHANGSIGIYTLNGQCGFNISLSEHIKLVDSDMLTTIDIFLKPQENDSESMLKSIDNNQPTKVQSSEKPQTKSSSQPKKFIVGDASGYITLIDGHNRIRERVTDGDSIWHVKSWITNSDREIVIVGAENSSWFIYEYEESSETLVLLYKNSYKDFNAGVTSISISRMERSTDQEILTFLLGSYDETIQFYDVKFDSFESSKPTVRHSRTIPIANGGIWRMKRLRGVHRSKLGIAAMYAGSYILSIEDTGCDLTCRANAQDVHDEPITQLVNVEHLELPEKPLHYDIDISCDGTYCIADFNNSLCLFTTAK